MGNPSRKSMGLFCLGSYDLDNFRVFIAGPFFHDVYEIAKQREQMRKEMERDIDLPSE